MTHAQPSWERGPSWRACKGCGIEFRHKSRTRQFHSRKCYTLFWERNRKPRHPLDPGAKGLLCIWCKARGDEVYFHRTRDKCSTCYRQAQREGTCQKDITHGPLRSKSVCRLCTPPPGTIKVVLLDQRFERERIIYRLPIRGCITVGHRMFTITAIPLVVSLPGHFWVRIRV